MPREFYAAASECPIQVLRKMYRKFLKYRNARYHIISTSVTSFHYPRTSPVPAGPLANMETQNLLGLVDQLDDNIDDLEDSLEPLLATALSATTKKLPVLDKAKLYVLIVYAIESLLFCTSRLTLAISRSED